MLAFKSALLILVFFATTSYTDRSLLVLAGYAAEIERLVVLPKGGGELACYERHYVLLDNDQFEEANGFRWEHSDTVVMADYLLAFDNRQPGIVLHDGHEEMPQIEDGGCSVLGLLYVPGDPHAVQASCSLTWLGELPEKIEPPVTC